MEDLNRQNHKDQQAEHKRACHRDEACELHGAHVLRHERLRHGRGSQATHQGRGNTNAPEGDQPLGQTAVAVDPRVVRKICRVDTRQETGERRCCVGRTRSEPSWTLELQVPWR